MALTAERLGTAFAPSPAVRGAALAAGAIIALAAANGGVAPGAWRTGALTLGALAGLLALWAPARPVRASTVLLLSPLAGYLALSVASAVWSADASTSLVDAQRTLFYLVALGAFLFAGEGLAAGVVIGAAAVGAWSLADRAVHGAPIDPYEGRLLTGPIGYANGLGALMAVGAAVCVALALRDRDLRLVAPLAVFIPALALTDSRGSAAATIAGCVVAGAVARGRRVAAAFVVAAFGALLTALLVVAPAATGDRAHYWHAAHATAIARPLAGTGAGTFGVVHVQAPWARDAHSLYLQTVSELGIAGLALILAVVAVPLVLAIRENLAAPAAGLTVFALHAGIDWDWQLPAITVAALALAAAAAPCGIHRTSLRPSFRFTSSTASRRHSRTRHLHD